MHKLTKLALLAAALVPLAAGAKSPYLSSFTSTYPATAGTALDDCSLCHPGGRTGSLNGYATAYAGASFSFARIENADSDNDGFTNVAEIGALSFPGDATSVPTAPPPAAAPKIAVSSTTLAFGAVTVGNTGQQQTTVSNGGDADLNVTVARCGGTSAEFSVSPASVTVAPRGSATISIQYKPADAGTDGGCIALSHNDPSTTAINVAVSGTGEAAAPPPPAVADLDITRYSVARRLDLSRGATAAPALSVVATVGGTATVQVVCPEAAYDQSQTVTLATGATAKVRLATFDPAGLPAGEYTFTATIADADGDQDVATVIVKVVP